MAWVASDMVKELGYEDIAEPLELTPEQGDLMDEMDGRQRTATLDAPHGWNVFESYGDPLIDQRQARRQAGIWSDVSEPPPFPIGYKHEEYFASMRAQRRWKKHFSVKRSQIKGNRCFRAFSA